MKKYLLVLIVCCFSLCISCVEKPTGIEKPTGRGSFDLLDAKNLYIGSVGNSKGLDSDFGEVTKSNEVKNVAFDFKVATNLSGYTALPDRIYQLSEEYILVRFGIPLILVRTSDGYGVCLNHINWGNHASMDDALADAFALRRHFKIKENGDIFYLGRYLSTKEENYNDMTGFSIMKYDRAENEIYTFFIYDTGEMRGGSWIDSILVDPFENTAAVSNDGSQGKNALIVALPQSGSPVMKEYDNLFYSSFIGGDGVFYFLSEDGYVSIKYDSVCKDAEISDLKTYANTFPHLDEIVVVNGKIYGLQKYLGLAICITAVDGTITDVQTIDTGHMKFGSWDYAGDYLYISEHDRIIRIDTADNSVSEVITGKTIDSFTVSEEHGITFVSKDAGSYSLWVQDLLATAMTKIQESTEAFQDLVKVD